MEFQEVVRRRHMVRTFTGEPVPPQVLDRILGNAVRGPSAGFSQGQAFLVLTGDDLPKFWAVAGEAVDPSARTAPLVIVPMSCKRVYLDRYAQPDKGWTDRDEARWPVPFWHIDTGMAALLILLTVVDENLTARSHGAGPVQLVGHGRGVSAGARLDQPTRGGPAAPRRGRLTLDGLSEHPAAARRRCREYAVRYIPFVHILAPTVMGPLS